jgi:hypothetical protein
MSVLSRVPPFSLLITSRDLSFDATIFRRWYGGCWITNYPRCLKPARQPFPQSVLFNLFTPQSFTPPTTLISTYLLLHPSTVTSTYHLSVIHVTCNLSKNFQITDSKVKKYKNSVNFYRPYEICKQFWVNSNMQTKLHFFISRSSPVPLIFKFCIFIRPSSCPPIIFAMTRSQKWTQDMAKITILYLHIGYHPKINTIQIHKADMVLIITFQEMSKNFHLYGIWYTDVMRFPFFTLKNLVRHDDDRTRTSQLLPVTWK